MDNGPIPLTPFILTREYPIPQILLDKLEEWLPIMHEEFAYINLIIDKKLVIVTKK